MKQNNNHIRGINMYVDERNRDIYYDIFTKNGYIIDEKRAKKFNMFKNRFILVFMGAVLAVNFVLDIKLTIIFSLLVIAALEYSFRFKFLPHCTMIPKFKKGNRAVFDNHEDKPKEILRIVLYIAFAVLIVMNAYISEFDTFMLALSYLASVLAMFAAIRSFGYIRK